MNRRRITGSTTSGMALLLVLLLGAGAWNYHRNLSLERTSERGRTYASYSVREVQLLRTAAEAELRRARARFEMLRGGRSGRGRAAGARGGTIQSSTRASDSPALRDAAADVAEHEQLMAALDQELATRVELGAGMDRHLRRLTAF